MNVYKHITLSVYLQNKFTQINYCHRKNMQEGNLGNLEECDTDC